MCSGSSAAAISSAPLPLVPASHPHARQEVVVDAHNSKWYLALPLCDRDYRVELGYRLPSGGWLHLAFSSVARMPASGPSEPPALGVGGVARAGERWSAGGSVA